jgi:hypothetical protein
MADKKISELTNITGANLADTDEFVVVDTSADETKAITFSELKEAFDTSTGFVRITGDTMTGDLTVPNIITSGDVDGRDVSVDGAKLDGIEAGATTDQTPAEIKVSYESNADTNAFTDAEQSKLAGIEAGADVTDTANVTAAGALMDSEVTNLAAVKSFDPTDYATSAQGTLADSAIQPNDSPTFVGLTVDTDTLFVDAANNRIGIGTSSPTEKLHVVGNILASGNITAYSDLRLKTDLQPIPDALVKVQSLTGYTYTRIDSGERHTGVVAQDVQKVLPEAVNDTGEHLSVAYGNMVGLLIEAIKEQQAQIDDLKARLES